MDSSGNRSLTLPRWPYVATLALAIAGFLMLFGHDHTTTYQQLSRSEAFGGDNALILTHAVTDALVGLSYVAISATAAYLAWCLRNVVTFHWFFVMCASFVLTCGFTHFTKVLTIFTPAYWASAGVNIATTVASVGTAMLLPYIVPQAQRLVEDAQAKNQAAAALKERNETLEYCVKQRTQELEESEQKARDAEEKARDLALKVVTSEQAERARLALEVHDGLTQTCVEAHQTMQWYQHDVENELPTPGQVMTDRAYSRITTGLGIVIPLTKRTIQESRDFIENLKPSVLDDFGLVPAIQRKVEQYREEGWDVDYNVTMPDPEYTQRASKPNEHAMYRVAGEALANIRKHAQATHITINLTFRGIEDDNPTAVLEVTDNGIGFDEHGNGVDRTDARPGERIGLFSHGERLRILGGDLKIYSTVGEGTTIYAELPIDDKNKDESTSNEDNESKERRSYPS